MYQTVSRIAELGMYIIGVVCIGYCAWRYVKYKEQALCFLGKARKILLMIVPILVCSIGALYSFGISGVYHIEVNEICNDNENIEIDENGTIADYIELYNGGMLACALDSLYLSDDIEHLKKYSLAGMVIETKEYLLINMERNSSFSIDKKGEIIYLSHENGDILDEISCPEMGMDYAYAKESDGTWKIKTCSPGEENVYSINKVEAPRLSYPSGFFEAAFYLEITALENQQIYYTLDGSVPSQESTLYEEPILVYDRTLEPNVYDTIYNMKQNWYTDEPDIVPNMDKAFVIRAIAVDKDGNSSEIVNGTYFVNLEKYKSENVLSILVDPEEMFGENGISVTGKAFDDWYETDQSTSQPKANFRMRGEEWEREVSVEFFLDEKTFQQDAGIRVQGASSRGAPRKRYSLFSRSKYSGSRLFNNELFEGKQTHSIVVGQSIANLLAGDLMDGRAVGHHEGEKVTVFINGECWYGTTMLEKYSASFFEETYGIDRDNIVVIKEGEVDTGYESDLNYYLLIEEYLSTHTLEEESEYEEICNMIDIDSFIDWFSMNVYLCNMDVGDTKNTVLWRTREVQDKKYSDGKWRWMVYDMDAMTWNNPSYFDLTEYAAVDSFSMKPQHCSKPMNQHYIYQKLKKVPAFREQFVLTFMDMVNDTFSIEKVEQKLKARGYDLSWNGSFFEKRVQYIVPYLAKEFELHGALENVVLETQDAKAGYIILNSIMPDLSDGAWIGSYFTDYPIEVIAVANPGYRFVGWSGTSDSEEETLEIQLEEGGVWLNAIFEKVE